MNPAARFYTAQGTDFKSEMEKLKQLITPQKKELRLQPQVTSLTEKWTQSPPRGAWDGFEMKGGKRKRLITTISCLVFLSSFCGAITCAIVSGIYIRRAPVKLWQWPSFLCLLCVSPCMEEECSGHFISKGTRCVVVSWPDCWSVPCMYIICVSVSVCVCECHIILLSTSRQRSSAVQVWAQRFFFSRQASFSASLSLTSGHLGEKKLSYSSCTIAISALWPLSYFSLSPLWVIGLCSTVFQQSAFQVFLIFCTTVENLIF